MTFTQENPEQREYKVAFNILPVYAMTGEEAIREAYRRLVLWVESGVGVPITIETPEGEQHLIRKVY